MKKAATSFIDAYRGLSPSAWWLSIVMLVNRMGTMVLPFMTLYMTERQGVSIGKAGLVITIFGLGTICGGFLGGKLTDKIGFYYIQLFSLISGGILFIVLGQMHDYLSICGVAFVLSLANESFRPANAAAIANYSETTNRTRSLALNRLAINLGWAVGGAVGGFVAAHSYHLLFWIDGLTNMAAALMLWLLLAPSKNKETTKKKEEHTGPVISAYKDSPFLLFVALNTIFAICFFQVFTTIPVYFKQDLFLSETEIGLVMALNGIIITVIEMVIVHQLEGRRPPLTYVIIGTVLVSAGFITLNIIPGMMMGLAIIFITLITFGEIINMPFASTYWMNRSNSKNMGQYAGLFTISWATAQIAGPSIGAQIAQHWGFSTLWWVIGIMCSATIAGYRWIKEKPVPEKEI
ncbi:MAG: MFS transporter [Chitinophagaceae bacterium]|nr:MFS transporter [Chitinophagaceae bacterium]